MRSLVLGPGGLVGAALCRALPGAYTASRALDLRDEKRVEQAFGGSSPTRVYLAAAKVGWRAEIPLRRGLEETYAWYREHRA